MRGRILGFGAATGATPHAWLLSQRLGRAEELLETTSLSIEQIAGMVGYRSAAVFREQFAARRGVAPRDYRRSFSRTALPPCSVAAASSPPCGRPVLHASSQR